MADASDYFEQLIIDRYFVSISTWAALFSSAPSDAGGGTEITGNGYGRQATTFARVSSIANLAADVTFTASGGAWATVTHMGIYDASTAGNLMVHMALDTSRTAADGESIVFNAATDDIRVSVN